MVKRVAFIEPRVKTRGFPYTKTVDITVDSFLNYLQAGFRPQNADKPRRIFGSSAS